MSEQQHTPTPWQSGYDEITEYFGIYDAKFDVRICDLVEFDNAQHIVRCVNSHAALLAACRAARDLLKSIKRTNGGTFEAIEAAISEAE